MRFKKKKKKKNSWLGAQLGSNQQIHKDSIQEIEVGPTTLRLSSPG